MIKVAPKAVAALLRRFGFGAITMPWGVVWILPERLGDVGLRAHEHVHLNQIEQDGGFRWAVTYLWWNLRYGYEDNPYEVEARTLSGFK